ncbi:MAG: DinB family protein [Terriglobales bacterium]
MKSLYPLPLLVGCLLAGLAAQAPRPTTLAQQLNRELSSVEREVVPAAKAMPADKYDFAPATSMGNFAGVRTFAQEVKHIAAANYSLGSALLGSAAPVPDSDNGPDNIQTKDQIVKFLQDSFAYAHHAVDSITPANALEPAKAGARSTRLFLAAELPAHSEDHYGQMVEYLRMNGLTPPASVNQPPANPKKP